MGHPTNTERSYWRKAAMPNADWLLISFHSVSSRWCGLDLAQQIATADIVVKASVVSRNVDNVILIMSTMLFGIMMMIGGMSFVATLAFEIPFAKLEMMLIGGKL